MLAEQNDYEIHILAATQVNWVAFNAICQQYLGIVPAKALDNTWIKITDFAAFAGCLNLSDPLKTLREHETCIAHASMSILIAWKCEPYIDLSRATLLKKLEYRNDRKHVQIFTGNMLEWLQTLVTLQRSGSYAESCKLANGIQVLFEKSGYKELFNEFIKITNQDGTFFIERR